MNKENSKLSQLSDEELLQRFQEGDLYAFDLIVHRYKDALFNFTYRYLGNSQEAEDVVQETFLRIFRNRFAYRQIAKFSTWIYTIARNLRTDHIRRQRAWHELTDEHAAAIRPAH